jgi:HSP20 family protein
MTSLAQPSSKPTSIVPSSPFADLRQQIDRVFESFFGGGFPTSLGGGALDFTAPFLASGAQVPSVEVKELADRYEITAELPGIDEKDVELSLQDGVLTVKGEKKSERKEEKENLFVSERSYGTFMRSFRVPENVDADRVAAEFEKGVLKITLPKAPEKASSAKKIAIQAK